MKNSILVFLIITNLFFKTLRLASRPNRLLIVCPSESTPQMVSRSVKWYLDRFGRFCIAHCRVSIYYAMGRPSPLKLPLPIGGSGPASNRWFRELTRTQNPNGISIGSALLAGLTSHDCDRPTDRQTDKQINRPTDHATRSVIIGRICVRSTMLRPNLLLL